MSDELAEAVVGADDDVATAHDEAFDGGVGEAVQTLPFQLGVAPVADVESERRAGEQQDGRRSPGRRRRRASCAGMALSEITMLGSGTIVTAPMAMK